MSVQRFNAQPAPSIQILLSDIDFMHDVKIW